MKTRIATVAFAASLGSLMTTGGMALAAAGLPPVHKAGNVEYLSGGIGKDESTAIERSERQWPLTLEFAEKDRQHGDFVADVDVVVRDSRGHAALKTRADGPFLLARLAPGQYAVDATLKGSTLHDQVLVKKGSPTLAVLVWPAGTEKTRS